MSRYLCRQFGLWLVVLVIAAACGLAIGPILWLVNVLAHGGISLNRWILTTFWIMAGILTLVRLWYGGKQFEQMRRIVSSLRVSYGDAYDATELKMEPRFYTEKGDRDGFLTTLERTRRREANERAAAQIANTPTAD